ncbi:MAG TPA: amidoligase family protein, partial [Candidatus Pullichristensenella stercoripullorum]|nr:amidoligase family protein [Candidatus Pullichristensenella stercoripullorum]
MKNQTFGVEIETTGLGRERTAQVIAELFGTTARYIGRHLGDWHIPMPDGRK